MQIELVGVAGIWSAGSGEASGATAVDPDGGRNDCLNSCHEIGVRYKDIYEDFR